FDIVGLLKDIGIEYHNQLGYDAPDDYLLSRVSERYFMPLENILFFKFRPLAYYFIQKLGEEQYFTLRKKIYEYRSFMLKLLRKWFLGKIEMVDKLHDVYQGENDA